MTEQACQVTPETRRAVRRYRRQQAWRHRRVVLWGRTFYRPWQRLLHRFDVHHCRKLLPVEAADRYHVVKCDWCGLHGRVTILRPERQPDLPTPC